MTRRSLRVRLWIGATASISLALLVAGLGLATLFERHVERRIGDELTTQLNQLAAAIAVASDGAIGLSREPLDPRFAQPLSGFYWQIDSAGQPGRLRSRSLWDHVIELPPDPLEPGGVHAHTLPGPGGQGLLVRERRIRLQAAGQPLMLRLAVGQNRAGLTAARTAFAADMRPYLGLIALVLALATLVQIQTGLAPLEAVRRGVGAIRSGQDRRLADAYPDEVMPLVSEVNALLDARAQAVERARAWTADLAHGLKTPLSALAADAQRLRDSGNPSLADDLEQLAQAMRRRVDRELIRARLRSGAADRQARVDVVETLQRLLRTLQRTPDGARLDWRIEAPTTANVALMSDDLLELLGNLLENAAKWARAGVWLRVSSGPRAGQTANAWIEICVSDDGPGVPAHQRPRLGERGLRLDQRREGTGLGLAIVQDVVDAYGGALAFDAAREGGLAVSVRLPAARRDAAA
ncbi:sensor histidine kinase [Thiocystis violascens]|uniref:histidine kinase n=1 Tax=Thiocystis violascens (strain ATCC 17096 / DSM 198 / 6111) TaxID=765911 RepID=I3YH04_THIV6|nr:HAMP domain-containing sensor histidine kinase [Thiocystis violascens]AFL76272.1 signal transduction histidine kinase [Thiocystis violascens DSM 198]